MSEKLCAAEIKSVSREKKIEEEEEERQQQDMKLKIKVKKNRKGRVMAEEEKKNKAKREERDGPSKSSSPWRRDGAPDRPGVDIRRTPTRWRTPCTHKATLQQAVYSLMRLFKDAVRESSQSSRSIDEGTVRRWRRRREEIFVCEAVLAATPPPLPQPWFHDTH